MKWNSMALAGMALLTLTACSGGPVQKSATSDSVLQVQYAAGSPYGAMSGEEASKIVESYNERIGTSLSPGSSSLVSEQGRYSSADRSYGH